METKPWTSGPKELLEHAKSHLKKPRPFDYRIAFISIAFLLQQNEGRCNTPL